MLSTLTGVTRLPILFGSFVLFLSIAWSSYRYPCSQSFQLDDRWDQGDLPAFDPVGGRISESAENQLVKHGVDE
ncbi:MAG: hypothetical protein A2029_00935 [Chloroflexi bacterium RBG_19FT_COMBO_47_9]|nr:MAG: hypothetical protein A2029_00935 [Chloroflexi bacterium RBG_19FT_COMBO_47_9]